jgi:hypothetical protein
MLPHRFLSALAVVALACCGTLSALAQQSQDPFEGVERSGRLAQYTAELSDYLSRVQYLSFAAECGVFPLKWNDVDLIIHSSEVRLMDLIRPLNLERNFYEKLKKQKNQAMLDGVAKAKNGCDYWHQNPDLVYRMRRLAAMAR